MKHSYNSIFDLVFFSTRIFDSIEGQQTIYKKNHLIGMIELIENDILAQWSIEVAETIHSNISKYLLTKTENGLLAMNFDKSVSIFKYTRNNLYTL